ncbi:SCO family protein [Rheinheimera riviphila]|uniref:SCO family protein n=1 Tax=Rheinheimera riviphila TaxID=1834037 RepID=A0A437QZE9_9GAMM|nr:SCO family protein [Rheinheimera riviphila]RVU39906.1 SCO family protein [Rheinheimera riviphila]
MKYKLIAAVAVVTALAAGIFSFQYVQQVQLPEHALVYPKARDLTEFTLTSHKGQPATRQQLQGQWTLAFVGYTFCPDICPMTMATLTGAYSELQAMLPEGQKLGIWFISADPERDTVSALANYVGYFEQPAITGLTAGHDKLFPFVRDLGLMYAISSTTAPDYLVDHSASIVLINPQGQLAAVFKPELKVGEVPLVTKAILLADFPKVLAQLQ